VFGEARPFAGWLALLLFAALLSTPLALLVPLPLQVVVDHVIGERPVEGFLARVLPAGVVASKDALLWAAAGMVLVLVLLVQAHALASWALQTWVGDRIAMGFRAKVFRHLQRLALGFHDARGTGDSLYRVQTDAASVHQVLVYGAVPAVASVAKVVALAVMAARVDLTVTLVALAAAPAFLLLLQAFRRRLRARWTEVREREAAAMAVVAETLGALRVVKAFGQEEREHGRYVARAGEGLRAEMRALRTESGFWLLLGALLAAGTAGVIVVGANHVRAGAITLGELLLVLGWLTQLYGPLQSVGNHLAGLQRTLAGADRAFALLDTAPDVEDRPGARPLGRARGDVAFEGVSFGYEEGREVLEDVTIAVPAGARVGISGPSGAGKTTLLGLLPRFHDPSAGRILLDGVDVRDVRLDDLRRQFAIVLQEPTLFSTTIRENIAYGRPDATTEEIVAAAKAANAHDFVAALPEGYETVVGERGMRLSGGERQRISIARAFLKDAPVLLLDEPTSSVDVATEASILDSLERLMRGRTTFLVAHRPQTLEVCDVRLSVSSRSVTR
jgi:ATP-binding cassette subfamily B protein